MRQVLARLVAATVSGLLMAAAPPPSPLPVVAGYVDLVTLATGSPVVLRGTIDKVERIGARLAPDVAAGDARFLVTLSTAAAIVAPGPVPPRVQYLADVPLDPRGRAPKLKGVDALVFLRPVAGSADQFSLANAHGQTAWTPQAEATVRAVLTEVRSGTVPVIKGITSAFRVPGAVPGEAESQFFLSTADGKPVSLVVLTRPGQPQRLSIALGDVIDEAAAGVKPETLLWYRLACSLPKTLPASVKGGGDDVAADYGFVLASLGPCTRTI